MWKKNEEDRRNVRLVVQKYNYNMYVHLCYRKVKRKKDGEDRRNVR